MGVSIIYSNVLSWIGRRKRRECALLTASQLLTLVEADENDSWQQVAVEDESQLKAFRSIPLGQPIIFLVWKLNWRVGTHIQSRGHSVSVRSEYKVQDGKLASLNVYAQKTNFHPIP